MVNPETIRDGRYTNLFCPECQANPDDLETHTDREGWRVLRCAYCLTALNATIDALATTPPGQPFDDRLFATDDS